MEKDWKSLEVKVVQRICTKLFSSSGSFTGGWKACLPVLLKNKCYVNETLRGFLAESTSDLSHLTIKHLQEAPGTALANLGVESLLTSSQTTTTTTQPTPLSSNFGPTPDPRGNIFASPDGNI